MHPEVVVDIESADFDVGVEFSRQFACKRTRNHTLHGDITESSHDACHESKNYHNDN